MLFHQLGDTTSQPRIIECAEKVIQTIVETYLAPDRSFSELRELMTNDEMDPIRPFGEACREKLQLLRHIPEKP